MELTDELCDALRSGGFAPLCMTALRSLAELPRELECVYDVAGSTVAQPSIARDGNGYEVYVTTHYVDITCRAEGKDAQHDLLTLHVFTHLPQLFRDASRRKELHGGSEKPREGLIERQMSLTAECRSKHKKGLSIVKCERDHNIILPTNNLCL